MFDTILIANRGEIAVRIIRTAKAMGLRTLAIYSSEDKDSLHVRSADSAFCVGDAQAKDSYLHIANIIQAALVGGAQAIHPGYGFLSENPAFAQACTKAGLVFIGPSIEAMQAMASKREAKEFLEKTAVPLTPGYHGLDQTEATLYKEALQLGFPVLIKAANGGGGKGMRTVHAAADFSEALAGAKREALAYFADQTVILEKLLINPRHIEVQIMADQQGNVVHLFERDCSIQRRHQKIIEEAPAPNLSQSLRDSLGSAACEVARSIAYTGAGTVEFLVDDQGYFYFMEMNTRLQVEHPVTEMITGLDLVEWQLRIASGETLPLTQKAIKRQGHAIECRIYAEDPNQGFIPSIGNIDFLQEPVAPGIRIDSGISQSSSVSMYYDPMLAKLIAWGDDRNQALQRLQRALAYYYIGGVKTNIPFLQAICKNPRFVKAALGTDFLIKETLDLVDTHQILTPLLAASFDFASTVLQAAEDPLHQATFAWQTVKSGDWIARYLEEGALLEVVITPKTTKHCQLTIHGQVHQVYVSLLGDTLEVAIDERHYKAQAKEKGNLLIFYTDKGQLSMERFTWDSAHVQAGSPLGQLKAPMPATVVALLKKVGAHVKAGEKLLILEAMKMEHTVHAPRDGVVDSIFYSVGDKVSEGAELVALRAEVD